MKLLFCPECGDVFNLQTYLKSCHCKVTAGRYTADGMNAMISGGIPLGFSNVSFMLAVKNQPDTGQGVGFVAFVIPKKVRTIRQL